MAELNMIVSLKHSRDILLEVIFIQLTKFKLMKEAFCHVRSD